MNRRDFLKALGIGVTVAAAPKFIFDIGANLYKIKPEFISLQHIIDQNTGIIHPYAGENIPSGYLLCNGQSISKTAYPHLFQTMGYTFGKLNNDKFNLPDLSSKFKI